MFVSAEGAATWLHIVDSGRSTLNQLVQRAVEHGWPRGEAELMRSMVAELAKKRQLDTAGRRR